MQADTPTTPNPELQLAHDFVQQTRHNIFLTGKAGTGKTTFLQQLKHETPKRMIVTAPTGVAAINAGGVTLHSFFQLPFGPYVPGGDWQQRRFSKEKIAIIKGLDLLVIDEISMVRADLLDGIDAVLRRFKHRQRPFGGVQLLMIGDLQQLPPVIKENEWQLLQPYYDTCYFFSSHALQQTDLISIELQHIYRQTDATFIELLNRVRNNQLDTATLQALNQRWQPDFQPGADDDHITLTTHNRRADQINDRRLHDLAAKPCNYAAHIEGDYPEYSYPTAATLTLKQGAQVMFVRNDSSAEKRFFNGKIGKIIRLDRERIIVKCPDGEQEITVEPVSWENIKYSLDEKTKEITEEVIGNFTQFPLRLAWAITIHKSQGLTFERAIIDAQAAFSPGQVYVALSRCKTLDGLVLSSPLSQEAVKTDATVAQFVASASRNPPTTEQLSGARIAYQQQLLLECFDFQPLVLSLTKLDRELRDNGKLIHTSASESMAAVTAQLRTEISVVADKFQRQLRSLFAQNTMPEADDRLQERAQKASHYFTARLQDQLIPWAGRFAFETDNKEIRKQIGKTLESLRHQLAVKSAALQSCGDRFTTSTYLHALAHAELESVARPHADKPADNLEIAEVEHPQLVQALKAWRAKQAAEEQVEHYRILHQRILLQIATLLPEGTEALHRIKGVGKATVEKYGVPIIALVSAYCREHNIEQQRLSAPPVADSKVPTGTKQLSYELFRQGKSIQEIAVARGLVSSTIETHLAHFVKLGELKIDDLLSLEKITMIKQAIAEKSGASLSQIKQHLGEACSYGEIRLVLDSMDNLRRFAV